MAREIIWHKVAQKMTLARLINLLKTVTGLLISRIMQKPVVFGIPPILQMEPTNYCNLKCPLCDVGNGKMTRPRGDFDLRQWRNLIDDFGHQISCILFYHQGEPMLAADFPELVRMANRQKIYTSCSSNGQLITPVLAKNIVNSGLDCLIISFDGYDQNSYAIYRQNGQFNKVKQGIRYVREAKNRLQSKTPYIILQCLLHRHNETQRRLVYQLGKKLGADRILFKNLQVTSIEEAREWLPKDEAFSRYKLDKNKIMLQKETSAFCPRPWTTSLINWDGSVVPCCFDKNATNVMGSLQQVPFATIWQNNKYKEFRKMMLGQNGSVPMCNQCHKGRGIWVGARLGKQNEA